ncbi:spore germination protein GerM [Desulfohalotomaculum tongense]|uniref:GerMN domain-containing protein n=1 Tax=Desulforadius tongensis TaxID=1216062 RepID=UPI00195CD034|nr:GerMN domain-containing protein [Desulforadius tongensis]MBM7855453.1 spore germination protein GerM [Desulforadius tongensis]
MYRKRQRYLIIWGLVLVLACLAACGQETAGEENNVIVTPVDSPEVQEPAAKEVAVLPEVMDKIPVVLYFANHRGYLVAQQREIPKVDGIARMTMQELAKGPEADCGLLPTLPPGTQLKDINIRDGVCIVDWTKELKENHPGGSSSELLTVYSIVNTLTQFSTVDKVQILVDGRVVETLAGHVDLSVPLEREDNLITSQ